MNKVARRVMWGVMWVLCGNLGLVLSPDPAALRLGPQAVQAEEASGQEFRQLIQQQMQAFRRNDAAGAFSFATPGLQQQFMTPDIFINMVKEVYMPVYRPKSVSFGKLRQTKSGPVQEVFVTGPDGDDWLALYSFAQREDGTWGISGCILRKDKGFQA
ncbi:DUF4864 domain-containing protein [Pannonibacter sp. Q-1]